MANVSAYAAKAALDWLLGGANPTRPSNRYIGLSYGTPDSTSASEITTPAYARQTILFNGASTIAGTGALATNSQVVSFGATGWTATIRGYQIWDASAGGNMLFQGVIDNATLPPTNSAFTCSASGVRITAL